MMHSMQLVKHCRTCQRDLGASEFSRDPNAKDGLRSECRECASTRAKEWRKANRERSDAGNKAYRQRHNDRQNARNAVMVALRRGEIHRQPCEVCGSTQDVHAHHDDYSKRLEVRWLCRDHHNDAHRAARNA